MGQQGKIDLYHGSGRAGAPGSREERADSRSQIHVGFEIVPALARQHGWHVCFAIARASVSDWTPGAVFAYGGFRAVDST